jgi:hypothetical protein
MLPLAMLRPRPPHSLLRQMPGAGYDAQSRAHMQSCLVNLGFGSNDGGLISPVP